MNQENLLDADNLDGYIAAAFATDDPSSIARALGEVARTRNMSKLAKDVGMNRSALYRALSGEGNPEFATILKVVKALGLKLTPVPNAHCKSGTL
ncbi:putative addiction module antidote protein [Rhizobium tropici]|uniref:Putative addiction module antidote protein n=1 Tax=Rhizobium tropici TaxID=398 RepID=A0A5B0VVQ6_RHITR|nr:addiction module antidote protein [Rhizobium tropici]KAA1178617.1 putative addiction module antidote protein [Rhizobium tropici]